MRLIEYGTESEYTGFNRLFILSDQASDESVERAILAQYDDECECEWIAGDDEYGSYLITALNEECEIECISEDEHEHDGICSNQEWIVYHLIDESEHDSIMFDSFWGNCNVLTLDAETVAACSHSGDCYADCAASARNVASLREQLEAVNPAELAEHLRDYGAWEDDELSDHDENLIRLVWLCAGDISEELSGSNY